MVTQINKIVLAAIQKYQTHVVTILTCFKGGYNIFFQIYTVIVTMATKETEFKIAIYHLK